MFNFRFTAVASPQLLELKLFLRKLLELLTPRMVKSSGSMSDKNQMSMSMEIQFVPDLQTRLENTLNWELSLQICLLRSDSSKQMHRITIKRLSTNL